MIEAILGSENRERVLIFILAREQGYASEIADFYQTARFPIQNQLDRFENAGVLISRTVGRTRLYEFNPRYAYLPELKSLLEKALADYPKEKQEMLLMNRRRPRRRGKPL